MSFRKRLSEQRRRRNKNLRGNTSADERPENRGRSRPKPPSRNKPKNFRDKSKGRTSPKKPSGLHTNGDEFTLNGKPYVGSYHIMSDGRAMTGSRHKSGFGIRRQKVLTRVTTPPPPPPTRTPSIPTNKYQKPNVKIPPKPARTPLTGVIVPPYKQLASYVNQYPATDSEVKEAANTDITSYYSGGTARGHRGARETIPTPSGVTAAQPNASLSINFVLNLDGQLLTSPQMVSKIQRARSEGNWYYLNSIPVINFNSSEVPPLSRNIFQAEEDYAFNSPTNQINDLTEKLNVIDWTVRKQKQLENPLPYDGRYDKASVVAGRITIDEIIASVGKPPKIRWRTSRG